MYVYGGGNGQSMLYGQIFPGGKIIDGQTLIEILLANTTVQ